VVDAQTLAEKLDYANIASDERKDLESKLKKKCNIADATEFRETLDSTDRKRKFSSICERNIVQMGKIGRNVLRNFHFTIVRHCNYLMICN
jgi:hypothetical protein